MKKQNNLIQLSHYIEQRKKIVPIDFYAQAQSIENQKILTKRFWAFTIDILSILLIKTAIDISYTVFIKNFYFFLSIKQQNHLAFGNLPLQWSVTMIIFWTYFVFCHYTLEGKTFGKMFMKLRTINDEFIFNQEVQDYTPSLSCALRRTFGYFVCYISFGTFFSFSFFSEDQRGVPDYFSGTRTVSDEWLFGMIHHKQYQSQVINISIRSLQNVA